MSNLAALVPFEKLCKVQKIPAPVAEHKFHALRRWRFDYAWLSQRVALEVEGGLFIRGRHSRGAGMLKDMEKYNQAAVMGWRVFRCTPDTLCTPDTFDMLREALK